MKFVLELLFVNGIPIVQAVVLVAYSSRVQGEDTDFITKNNVTNGLISNLLVHLCTRSPSGCLLDTRNKVNMLTTHGLDFMTHRDFTPR